MRHLPRTPTPFARAPAILTDGSAQLRVLLIGLIFGVALIAFEIFNFDTTRYALSQLLGDIQFAGIGWATVLATAFCGIDFAGLLRVFSPEDKETSHEVWYLMAAWLLGATLNAIMTWYAVSITLVENGAVSPIMTQETLLKTVPIFVSVLVWLTRILFIGALTMTADRLLQPAKQPVRQPAHREPATVKTGHSQTARQTATLRPRRVPTLNPAEDTNATLIFTPHRRPVRSQPVRG